MSVSERVAPVMGAVAAVSTLLCCLPVSFAGALGLAGLSAAAVEYHWWLIGGATGLLVVGFVQLYRRPAQCAPRSRSSVVLTWLSAALVAIVFLMPQLVATLLADWFE